MSHQIALNDIRTNTLFWYSYISWFNGFDEENEINIDEALETTSILDDDIDLQEWQNTFFNSNTIISGKINEKVTFLIEFKTDEIVYFLNDIYIGNLGGHFQAWFLTLDELTKIGAKDSILFMLLLPMTGLEKQEITSCKAQIIDNLKSIPKFETKADYIAECISNGITINGHFHTTENGVINDQNHSVRNIDKYPRYRNSVIELNEYLKLMLS
ncbi:hypothetical protein GCM10009430_22430 [Aquimarina litoralis]|uniref:Immunity protein 19 n=1 Tax=Aquimarina litoralis TaxID=584605 RepID=A0ABP3U3E2_9FLAO